MPQMNKVIVTRMGLNYSPPTLAIEYRNGQNRRNKHHSHIPMKRYLDRYASGYPYMSPVERSMAVQAIVDVLVNEHVELQQVPLKPLRRLIEKLYSSLTQNSSVASSSVGDEYREEQSTDHSYGDTSRDHTLDHALDPYLGRTALDCVGDGIMTDYSSVDDTPAMSVQQGTMYVNQTHSAPVLTSSSTNSHGKNKRTIIEETKRLDEEAKVLRKAIRLVKQWEQVDKKQYITNKGNSLKKDRPVPASKLVVEYPAPFKRERTTAMAADENFSDQVTERRGTTKIDTSAAKRKTSKLLLLEVAKSKAEQIDLLTEGKRIKMQLSLEKKAEKKARRGALIAIKKEKKERQREIKAAAKERKLLSIQQRAEEKSARIAAIAAGNSIKKAEREAAMKKDLRLALERVQGRKARNTKEMEYQSHVTPYQKKTKTYGMTGHNKRWFADSPQLVFERDENDEFIEDKADFTRMKNEIFKLKEKLSRLQSEKEQRKEAHGVGNISNFLCGVLPFCNKVLLADGDNNSRSELPSSLHHSKLTKGQNSRRLKRLRNKEKRTIPLCLI